MHNFLYLSDDTRSVHQPAPGRKGCNPIQSRISGSHNYMIIVVTYDLARVIQARCKVHIFSACFLG